MALPAGPGSREFNGTDGRPAIRPEHRLVPQGSRVERCDSIVHLRASPTIFTAAQAIGFGEPQELTYPVRNDLHRGTRQYSLHPMKRTRKGRRFPHDLQELKDDGGGLQSAPHGIEQRPPFGIRARRVGRTVKPCDRSSFTIHRIEFRPAERFDVAMVGVSDAERGGGVDPGQQRRIAGPIRCAGGSLAGDFGMHSGHACDHGQRYAARAVDGHHRR